MKKYVIMINYHLEGWKIFDETDDFDTAIWVRECGMGNGNQAEDVVIFRPVVIEVTEKE